MCCIFVFLFSSLCAHFVEKLGSLYFLKHNTNLRLPEYVVCIFILNIYMYFCVGVYISVVDVGLHLCI